MKKGNNKSKCWDLEDKTKKKNKVMIKIITWKYHGNEEIMRMAKWRN